MLAGYLADTWQDCMKTTLGEPKDRINDKGTLCDRMRKVMYESIELTKHFYNIVLQTIGICHYYNELKTTYYPFSVIPTSTCT